MKRRSLRRAAALLLSLALACSLLTVPAAAAVTFNPPASRGLELDVNTTGEISLGGDSAVTGVTWEPQTSDYVTLDYDPDTDPIHISVSAKDRAGSTTFKFIITTDSGTFRVDNYTIKVNPEKVDVEGVKITNKDAVKNDLLTGQQVTLIAAVEPSNATNKNVTWKSDNENVVTIDEKTGVLTAVGPSLNGRYTKITVTTEDGGIEDFCEVYVKPAPLEVEVKPGDIPLTRGDTATLTATVTGYGAERGVIWSSSNPDAVSVNPVTGETTVVTVNPYAEIGEKVTIYAQAEADRSVDDVCIVSVVDEPTPKVTRVVISGPSNLYVDPKGTVQLTAAAEPAAAAAADRKISWECDPPGIVKVSPKTGSTTTVTGVAPGMATITATAAGGGEPDTCTVEVSGILLSYRPSAGTDMVSLTENGTPVSIYQYRDITVIPQTFGNAKGQVITWSSSNNTVAQVIAGRVTGTYPGESIITANVNGTGLTASFKVNVSEDVADAITVSMGSDPSYPFSSLMNQLNDRSQKKAGGPLESISSLKVSTENGALYYGYTSLNSPGHGIGGTERFYYQPMGQGQMSIRDVTFVPLPGFDGTAVVDYTGTATNGTTFNGTIRIEATASGDVSYSTEKNQPVAFAAEHFSAVCMGRNGQSVRYINFSQPTNGRGTLYYNYVPNGQYSPKVVTSTAYYVSGNPSIDGITFVPATDFVGSVDIPYRCIDSSGASFTGTVTVTVQSAGGSATTGDVEYSIARNQRQSFRASDFNDACQRIIGGTLDYIRFTDLPSSTAGILYLNYTNSYSTRVATGRSYYRNSSPYISNISFVPATDYSGTVTIPFTAANTSGDTFSGTLVIHVDNGVGTVHYSTTRNQTVTFAAADFNDVSRRINGTSLNYIRFTGLPSSSAGTLYLNYTSSSSTRVSTGRSYYRSGSPSLSNVTFVPASGYNGTVTIPFTAYDDNGGTFSGTVTIAVGIAGEAVSYSTDPNGSVRFSGADFNNACRYATGYSLSYVRFDLPASRYGTLYYQYNSSTRTGNSVASGTNYYYSGNGNRLISDVSFAASSTTGTVTFGYTGYSTVGNSFSGTVEIRVSSSAASIGTSIRYSGSSAPVAFRASDFQNICQMTLGSPLSYVQFTSLPTVGQLNQNYGGPAQTGAGVNTVSHYGTQELDQISYLPRAEYQGTIYVPYTLYDTQGHSHSSSVEIQLSNDYNHSSFSDIASGYWASPSIEFLRNSGITNGYSDNTYRPAQSISRGEFTLMICRAFQFSTTGSSGFPDVPANSTYAGAVASARELGIVEGNNGLFQPDRPITRQSAMTMICRAMDAAGRAIPAADTGSLSSYADGGRVSSFARSSVASLIQMGVVRGDNSNKLNPTAAISRAEMAVILHRVLSR